MQAVLVSRVVDGVVLGALIALIALGYTSVRRQVRLIDFAYGRVHVIGAYGGLATCACFLPTFLRQGWYLALPALLVAGAIVAVVVAAVLDPVTNSAVVVTPGRTVRSLSLAVLLATGLVVSVALHEAVRMLGPGVSEVPAVPGAFASVVWEVAVAGGTVAVPWTGVVIVGLAVAVAFALRTRVNDSRCMVVRLFGRDGSRSEADLLDVSVVLWFALVSALVGLAGILYGSDPAFVVVDVGYRSGLVAFAAAVVGWNGRVGGAVAGGAALGLAVALGGDEPPGGLLYDLFWVVVVLLLVLSIRPGSRPRATFRP
jgi:branched-chain amino acid transport system permease protein